MPTLRTGLVIAGAYATKARRTMFAQLRGKVENREIARAVAELNQMLYEIIVNSLKIDKGDVVRITIDYNIVDGKIEWNYESLKIEAFKRIPDEEVAAKVRDALGRKREIMERTYEYAIEKVADTEFGDLVYKLKVDENEAGLLLVTPANNVAVVRGVVEMPTPKILKKTTIKIDGDLESALKAQIQRLIEAAEEAESEEEVEKARREIEELME